MSKYFFQSIILCLICNLSLGQTQTDLNKNEYETYKKAENEINAVYQKILKQYSANTEFIKNLKISERLWIQFRDAELNMKYPGSHDNYGSVFPMCANIYLTQLTNERIKTLRVWLTGIPEGDICSGSVKIKE